MAPMSATALAEEVIINGGDGKGGGQDCGGGSDGGVGSCFSDNKGWVMVMAKLAAAVEVKAAVE